MMNYFKALLILIELSGKLVAAATIALLGCTVLIAASPILALIFKADDLEQIRDI